MFIDLSCMCLILCCCREPEVVPLLLALSEEEKQRRRESNVTNIVIPKVCRNGHMVTAQGESKKNGPYEQAVVMQVLL